MSFGGKQAFFVRPPVQISSAMEGADAWKLSKVKCLSKKIKKPKNVLRKMRHAQTFYGLLRPVHCYVRTYRLYQVMGSSTTVRNVKLYAT